MNDKNLKKCVLKVFNFVKKNFILENPRFFLKSAKFFSSLFLNVNKKEHVHNLNRRWARSALKA